MKIVSQNKLFKCVRYGKDDFMENQQKIAEDFANIFTTSPIGDPELNHEDAQERVSQLMLDFVYDDMRCFMYFIYENNALPVSVVVYSETNHHFHLEMIATREDYKSMGFASELCLKSFADLASDFDIDTITATVSKENYPSLYLQESLMRNENIKCDTYSDEDRIGFEYYVKNLVDAPQMEE